MKCEVCFFGIVHKAFLTLIVGMYVVLNFFPIQTQWSIPTTWRWRQRNSCKRHSGRMGLWWRKLWRHHRRSQGIHLQVVGQKFQVSTDLQTSYLSETAATLCHCTNHITLLSVAKQNQKLSLPPLSLVNLSAHTILKSLLRFLSFPSGYSTGYTFVRI